MDEASTTKARRSSRIAKRLKSSHSSKSSDAGSAEKPTERASTSSASPPSSQVSSSNVPCTGTSPIADDNLLQKIFSFVGDSQYLFVGGVSKSFEKAYATLFPNKSTSFNASTLEHTSFCWDHIATSIKDDDETKDKQRRKLFHSAIRCGKIEVVKYLLEQLPPPQKNVSFKNIRFSEDRKNIDWKYDLCYKAAKYGQMEVLQWACNENICVAKDDRLVCHNAIANGHIDMFRWALQNGFVFVDIELAAYSACRKGQFEALKWISENYEDDSGIGGYRDSSCGCCNSAAQRGQLEILKWLHEHYDTNCNDYTMRMAISSGHLETVKFLLAIGCQSDSACYEAVEVGSLDILKALVSHDCEWDDAVIDGAAARGHLDIIEWANDNGIPFTDSACHYAAGFGQLDTLKWLRAKGCPWDEDTTKYASTDEIYDWAKSNGCPVAKGNPRETLKAYDDDDDDDESST
jgi:ankyrin repeat protein